MGVVSWWVRFVGKGDFYSKALRLASVKTLILVG